MIKILIVEDEPGIYTFLQEGLTDEGYDTLVATDGSDALRDFADWRPDLVLLDWMLPTKRSIPTIFSASSLITSIANKP